MLVRLGASAQHPGGGIVSAWEGSAMQEQWERVKDEKAALHKRVARENPSLVGSDIDAAVELEWQRLHPAPVPPKPKCCPCQGPARAEYIRVGTKQGGLHGPTSVVVCPCNCHKHEGVPL